jgi:D-methionine transport system substrate-binding protein
MKKILLTTLLAASIALLSGCNKDNENQIKVAIKGSVWKTEIIPR